jgi:hypothetical protein
MLNFSMSSHTGIDFKCPYIARRPSHAAMQKLRIVTFGFVWEIAHGAITRRPPISFYTIVARTGGYA